MALNRGPDDSRTENNLAWLLASRTASGSEDVRQAVELARKAVTSAPQNGVFWNTLGVCHYRAGDWISAASALDQSMRLRSGGDAYDWLFLAMVRHHQGRKDNAREWYDRALAWMKANSSDLPRELAQYRAEATRLLATEKASLR
jgi:Flp pilus assembly protein TadD